MLRWCFVQKPAHGSVCQPYRQGQSDSVSRLRQHTHPNHEAIVTRAQWNAAQRILNSSGKIKTYQPMRIIDHGVLCGYISMNRFWGGFTPEDYYRVASIAMGMTEGDLDADLENEYLPEGGMPLVGLASEDGILRIARELTKEEKRYQAEKNGEVYEEEEEIPAVQPIFQVVDGAMFSHAYEPVARFTKNSITFNSTCVAKFNRVRTIQPDGSSEKNGEVVIDRVKHVKMLLRSGSLLVLYVDLGFLLII